MTEMRTFKLNKLVRDKIVEDHQAIGGSATTEKLEGQRLTDALIDKLQEELAELKYGKEVSLEELADISEVIDALAIAQGHNKVELDALQYDKKRRVGAFAAGIFVHTVTVPASSELSQYYASNPERFPEVSRE